MVSSKQTINRRIALVQLVLLIAILAGINIVGSTVFHRFDLTAEKRFSISEPTKELLRNLDDIVTITVFLDGDLSPNISKLRNETLEILNQFRQYGGGNFQYQVFDPNSISDRDNRLNYFKELQERGMISVEFRASQGETVSSAYLFPYAEVSYRDADPETVILLDYYFPVITPQYDPSSAVALLEYNFASAIRKSAFPSKPKVAFVEGQGELDSMYVLDMTYALKEFYEVDRFDLSLTNVIDSSYQALIIAKPQRSFSKVNKYKIDQYIMRGGSVLWFIDGVIASFDSLIAGKGEFFSSATPLDVEDQLFQYGVRVNENLIQDQQCARIAVPVGQTGQYDNRPWLYSPIFTNLNAGHPITRSLDAIKGEFASSLDTTGVPGIKKTFLVRTSANSRLQPDPVRVRFTVIVNPPRDEQFNKPEEAVAVLLEGEFPSAFTQLKLFADQFKSRGVGGSEFITRSKPTRMLIVSDGDMIQNAVSADGRIAPLGSDRIEQYIFANKDFILNAVEYLTDDSGLMETRAKEIRLRPLDQAKVRAGRSWWTFLSIAAPLLILFLLGGIYNIIRYRRYSSLSNEREEQP